MELGTHGHTSKRWSSFRGKSSTRTIHSSCILLLSNFLRGDTSCSAIFSIGNYQWISNFANISKWIEPTNFTGNPHPVSCYDFRNHRLGTDEIRYTRVGYGRISSRQGGPPFLIGSWSDSWQSPLIEGNANRAELGPTEHKARLPHQGTKPGRNRQEESCDIYT